MSIDVVIDCDPSSAAPGVVPVISTVWESRMRIVSPMGGRIWRRTDCPGTATGNSAAAAHKPRIRTLEAIRIVVGKRADACRQRSWGSLCGYDLPELRTEVGFHVSRSGEECGVARAKNFLLGVKRRDVLDPRQRDRRIERTERAQNRRLDRHVAVLRIALGAFPSLHHRRAREANENRLREMWMTNHQLSFFERRELCPRRGTENGVTGRRQLVGIHSSEKRRPRITDYPAVNLRAKL